MTWSVTIKDYHAVASWTWAAGDKGDVCSICRMPFDGCPPDCKVPSLSPPPICANIAATVPLACSALVQLSLLRPCSGNLL